MKQIKFLAMALAVITMFSCSKENDVENLGSNDPGDKSTITIKVTGEGNVQLASKALGEADITDVDVNNYIVFIFREGGTLDCPPHYQSTNENAVITNATTAAKIAYVVANTGGLENGSFANIHTEEALIAITGDLMSETNISSQTMTNLWMSGIGNIAYGEGDEAKKGTVTVALGFVAAKIELVVKDARTKMTGFNITIADNEVVLLYAGKLGKFFGGNQSVQNNFYSGDISYGPIPAPEKSTALLDDIGTPFTINDNGEIFNHFYAFGNDGTTKPTILAIKSTRTIDGTSTTIYYPVQFTMDDAKHLIVPGESYTVTITLKGDVSAGGGGGTTDPEIPVIGAEVEVKITAAKWTPLTVDKEFK